MNRLLRNTRLKNTVLPAFEFSSLAYQLIETIKTTTKHIVSIRELLSLRNLNDGALITNPNLVYSTILLIVNPSFTSLGYLLKMVSLIPGLNLFPDSLFEKLNNMSENIRKEFQELRNLHQEQNKKLATTLQSQHKIVIHRLDNIISVIGETNNLVHSIQESIAIINFHNAFGRLAQQIDRHAYASQKQKIEAEIQKIEDKFVFSTIYESSSPEQQKKEMLKHIHRLQQHTKGANSANYTGGNLQIDSTALLGVDDPVDLINYLTRNIYRDSRAPLLPNFRIYYSISRNLQLFLSELEKKFIQAERFDEFHELITKTEIISSIKFLHQTGQNFRNYLLFLANNSEWLYKLITNTKAVYANLFILAEETQQRQQPLAREDYLANFYQDHLQNLAAQRKQMLGDGLVGRRKFYIADQLLCYSIDYWYFGPGLSYRVWSGPHGIGGKIESYPDDVLFEKKESLKELPAHIHCDSLSIKSETGQWIRIPTITRKNYFIFMSCDNKNLCWSYDDKFETTTSPIKIKFSRDDPHIEYNYNGEKISSESLKSLKKIDIENNYDELIQKNLTCYFKVIEKQLKIFQKNQNFITITNTYSIPEIGVKDGILVLPYGKHAKKSIPLIFPQALISSILENECFDVLCKSEKLGLGVIFPKYQFRMIVKDKGQYEYVLSLTFFYIDKDKRMTPIPCITVPVATFDWLTVNAFKKFTWREKTKTTTANYEISLPNFNEFLFIAMYGSPQKSKIGLSSSSSTLLTSKDIHPVELPFIGLYRIFLHSPTQCFTYDYRLYNESVMQRLDEFINAGSLKSESCEAFLTEQRFLCEENYLKSLHAIGSAKEIIDKKYADQYYKNQQYRHQLFHSYEIMVGIIRLITNNDAHQIAQLLNHYFGILHPSLLDNLIKSNVNRFIDEIRHSEEAPISPSEVENFLANYMQPITSNLFFALEKEINLLQFWVDRIVSYRQTVPLPILISRNSLRWSDPLCEAGREDFQENKEIKITNTADLYSLHEMLDTSGMFSSQRMLSTPDRKKDIFEKEKGLTK